MNLQRLNRLNYTMTVELYANAHKGDFDVWRPSASHLHSEIQHHVNKLQSALHDAEKYGGAENAARVDEYSADVANFMLKAQQVFGNPI